MEFLEGVPDVLYKYRDWNNVYHQNMLFDQQIYFASIDQFNDPFDGGIPWRYNQAELTEANIFEKYRSMAKRDNPEYTEEQIHALIYDQQRRGVYHDDNHMERFRAWSKEKLNKEYGVFCTCKSHDNFLLWSHYANNHTGICFGFDKYILFEVAGSQFGNMHYQDEIPVLGLFDNVFEHFKKILGTKSRIWEYEQEYRLLKPQGSRSKLRYPPEALKEIHFGCKMQQDIRSWILNSAKEQFPNVMIYEKFLSETNFKLETLRIY